MFAQLRTGLTRRTPGCSSTHKMTRCLSTHGTERIIFKMACCSSTHSTGLGHGHFQYWTWSFSKWPAVCPHTVPNVSFTKWPAVHPPTVLNLVIFKMTCCSSTRSTELGHFQSDLLFAPRTVLDLVIFIMTPC